MARRSASGAREMCDEMRDEVTIPSTTVWVRSRDEVYLVNEASPSGEVAAPSLRLTGSDKTIWDLLVLGYPLRGVAEMLAAIEEVSCDEAGSRVTAFAADLLRVKLLRKQG